MTTAWQINASPLMLHSRPRSVRLASEAPVARPSREDESSKREELAYARGRMDGERAVNEQLLRQRQDIHELQERVLEPLRRAVGEVVRDSEQSLVELAIQVAERLVSDIPVSHEMVQAAVQEALKQTKEAAECHIYLHPDDLQLLHAPVGVHASACREDENNPGASTPLHFHASHEVERGGCVVKTRFGTVDGQRRTKVEQLRRTLLS